MTHTEDADGRPAAVSRRVFAAAAVTLLLWAGFTAFMAAVSGSSSEVHWTRLTWLFSTVEAVVFGAAGALFGASVQRQRAETAERRANANERDAISGRALAAATLADGAEAAMSPGEEAYGPRQPGSDVATRHAAIARNLFPDIAEPRS